MIDYASLHKKLERALLAIHESPDISETLESILGLIVEEFGQDLGFESGRLYRLVGEQYELERVVGGGTHPRDFRLPLDYVPIARVRAEGYVMMGLQDPGVLEEIEKALGSDHFAAICFGPRREYIVSFTLASDTDPGQVLFSLNAVRHACDMKLRQRSLDRVMQEAREIQQSLVSELPPSFPGYTLAARSCPADLVGGDVYLFVPVSEDILAFAVADVAGHGLPAALQARDVVIGLKMGISENLKMVVAIEKLNRVIHETSLASKFVTLFYGEVEPHGNLVYVNAGHLPGLVVSAGGIRELRQGGMVLGPSPASRYQRGFCELKSGDLLALYSDGVVEAEDPSGIMYGQDRLEEFLQGHRELAPRELVDRVFEDVDRHSGSGPQSDDRTLVLIKRT